MTDAESGAPSQDGAVRSEDPEMEHDPIAPLVQALLKELGEDPGRGGLEQTPGRVAKAMRFFTKGYAQSPRDILGDALFDVSYDEMVLVKDIEFYSLCEHHLLPFFGRVQVAYIPNGKVVGLSKIPRLVEMFARRLQVQERLTVEIAETIDRELQPRGVAVVVEAIHLCMMMRGVEQQNSFAITSSLRGAFQRDSKTRAEFMELIRHHKQSFA
jgi:GTP cyclohydrolase I